MSLSLEWIFGWPAVERLKPARFEPAQQRSRPTGRFGRLPGHFFAALHPAASPHRATGAASERRVGLVRRSQWRPAKAARLAQRARGSFGAGRGRRPGAAGDLLRELAVWTRLAELLGVVAAGAPPRRWRLGASLRDVPPRSCFAAGAQGPDGDQRQRQQRPGDDRGGGGCPRRSAGSRCACPATWGTRLGYSRGCSLVAGCCTGVPQQRWPTWPPKSTGAGV